MRLPLVAMFLFVTACAGDNVAPPDASSPPPDAAVDVLEPSCAVLGCLTPTCTATGCTCNGTACVPTGIPKPVACASLACVSLACGMGDEALVCQCEIASGTFQTCLAE